MPCRCRAERSGGWRGDGFERRDPGCGRPRARRRRPQARLRDPRAPRRSRTAAHRSDIMSLLARILRPRGLLVAMHLPFFAFTAARTITGLGFDSLGNRWSALPLVLTAAAIQVHHSLAAADGIRPRHWKWTLLLLFLITYLPTPLFMYRWPTFHWYLIASLLILLPGRVALAAAVTDAVGLSVWLAVSTTVA